MSKSVGNVIAPEDILKKYGADILRIWVTSSNYAEDLRIDYSILEQHADSYRKIRNTFRYLLGNLNDDFKKIDLEKLDLNQLPELEQYMLHRVYELNKNFKNYFKSYDFHNLYKELLNFCTVDLSAFYFDIRKDALYCDSKDSVRRKSCIVVLNIILESIIKWIATIVSCTSEEIFMLISKDKKSIHLEEFMKFPKSFENEQLNKKWIELKKIRDICNISIEAKRASKEIGSSLEANISINLDEKMISNFESIDFSELCITSSAIVKKTLSNEITVITNKAEGEKCSVCWKINKNGCERHPN
jgi:isoleucyl-tRNA synthetase